MPNLEHDPQKPTDLLGRPIADGDIVAWGTTYGRSPALCIGCIEKIRFIRKNPIGYNPVNIECPQHLAEDYQLRLTPIKSTGSVTTSVYNYQQGKYTKTVLDRPKTVTILLVKNVVKLEPFGPDNPNWPEWLINV